MTTSSAPPQTAVVRAAAATDAPHLARVLAAAFLDDPVFAWFFPRDAGRAERNERFFRHLALPATLPHGASATTADLAGAALWAPPGAAHASFREAVAMLPGILRVAGRHTPRSLRGMSAMERVHPREDHWYLWFLGVAPAVQGRGVGTQLLEPILRRCDATETPAYLEATTERNRALYERLGFVTRDVLHLPGGGPPLWPMWRAPRC